MTVTPPTSTATATRTLRSFVLLALVLPALFTIVAIVLQLLWLPALPNPATVHWGMSGEPNGFGPAWTYPLITLGLSGVLPLFLGLSALGGLRRGDRGFTYRFIGAMSLGLSLFGAVLMTWSVAMQRGLADAHDAPSPMLPLLIALALAVAVGVVGWFVQPKSTASRPTTVAAVPLTLAPGEKAVWTGNAVMGKLAMVVIGAAVLLLLAASVLMWMTADIGVAILVSVLTVVVVAVALSSTAFHVRVDEHGLTVRSEFGVPRFNVPLSDVEATRSVQVNPMGEFGGWGMRWAPGRFGVVLRTGAGIEVMRRSGKLFVVTVDDAATGAALLAALTERASETPTAR